MHDPLKDTNNVESFDYNTETWVGEFPNVSTDIKIPNDLIALE